MMKATICAVVMTLGIGTAVAADATAGHGHARKANSLAGAGKCKQAIPEFTAAYRLLHDPALLFNRAECLRKVGQSQQALYDYRRFLEEMPEAPNRSGVEKRIRALDPSAALPQTKKIVESPPAAPSPPAEPTPIGTKMTEEVQPALHTAALRIPAPIDVPPPAPRNDVPVSVIVQPAPARADQHERSAWIWMSVATAVVAAAAVSAAIIASKPHNP
jgi:tetratricopeptide (TPR) repeat protein